MSVSLGYAVYNNPNSQAGCGLCLENTKKGVAHSEGGEKHPICEACVPDLKGWFLKNDTQNCPTCRKTIDLSTLLTQEQIGNRSDLIAIERAEQGLEALEGLREAEAREMIENPEFAQRAPYMDSNDVVQILTDGDLARSLDREERSGSCLTDTGIIVAIAVATLAVGYPIYWALS